MLKKFVAVLAATLFLAAFGAWGARSIVQSQRMGHCNTCINYQKQIDSAKETWRLDNKRTDADAPTWADLVGKGRYFQKKPVCPDGGTYTIGKLNERPTCSIPAHRPQP